ncbi:MAG: rRNA maturation RNase YbeY [Chitinophagaceae bacterium]|nr:rRNA maturation RNase YbeY [Chitinophagaceae bacterium]
MAIHFTEYQVKAGLLHKRNMKTLLTNLIKHYTGESADLGYTFVSDDYLYEMNKNFLHHDTLTDIITFDLSPEKYGPRLGDVYISVDRVRENAEKMGIPYYDELCRVIIHGALHLCGYGDKTPAQKKAMRALEDEWLSKR